jgi:mycothiol synthase
MLTSSSQPCGSTITLRPIQAADSQHIVDLINANSLHFTSIRRAVVDAVGQVRLIRYVPPSAEKVVALDGDSRVVGYAYLADRDQSILYETGGSVHPAYHGLGVGSLLLDWAQERTVELSRSAPPGIKTVLQANVFEAESSTKQLFESAGFAHIRDWLHFEINLTTLPPMPVIPPGISLHVMDLANDWDLVGPAMEEAFSDHWGTIALPTASEGRFDAVDVENVDEVVDELLEDETYSNAPGFCFYARAGSQVVGGVLCNVKLVEREDTGRVGSLFVRPAYRRQGLGQALMHEAFRTFWQHGLRRVILDTDAESFTAAPRFYTRLGMRVYRRERLYEKTIRNGVEARRLQRP